jgi:hypothetical protein
VIGLLTLCLKGLLRRKSSGSLIGTKKYTKAPQRRRNELNSYLHAQGLDGSIPNDDDKWAAFLSYYVRVIEDCPLKCISQGLRYVDEVVLNVLKLLPTRALANGFQLAIEWSWKSKITGRVFTNQQLY